MLSCSVHSNIRHLILYQELLRLFSSFILASIWCTIFVAPLLVGIKLWSTLFWVNVLASALTQALLGQLIGVRHYAGRIQLLTWPFFVWFVTSVHLVISAAYFESLGPAVILATFGVYVFRLGASDTYLVMAQSLPYIESLLDRDSTTSN